MSSSVALIGWLTEHAVYIKLCSESRAYDI
jgi:hypothetical protein